MSSPFDAPDQRPQDGSGSELPPSPFPDYFAPGQQPPPPMSPPMMSPPMSPYPSAAQPYFSPGQQPKPVMPSVLTAVIVVHWVLGGLTMVSALFSPDVSGGAAGSVVSMLAGIVSVGAGVYLYVRPGEKSRIAATVVSVGWCLSCIGLVVSVPVLLALWKSREVVTYLELSDRWRDAQP